jgi:cell division protein FtsN
LTSSIAETAIAKPKPTALPVLVILFLLSYGLMATLVVEQGRTIDSQRGLIHQLFDDSIKLSMMQGGAAQKAHADAQARAQAQAKTPQASPQQWQAKPPGPAPQANTKNGHAAGKVKKPAPLKPPKATSDEADERRTLISI